MCALYANQNLKLSPLARGTKKDAYTVCILGGSKKSGVGEHPAQEEKNRNRNMCQREKKILLRSYLM
jgi:hypothetical protein